MRNILSYPLMEEDRGILPSSGGGSVTSCTSSGVPWESLPLSEGDRYEAEYFQRQLNNAKAQMHLASGQKEEAKKTLAAITKKYQTQD